MAASKLTDLAVRNAKKRPKDYRLPDGAGLFLYVTAAGGKVWRLRYEFEGREKTLTIGPYPLLSLNDARLARDAAKKHLFNDRDPGVEKHSPSDAGPLFSTMAEQWFKLQKDHWSLTHTADVLRSLESETFKDLGKRPISSIRAVDVLTTLRKIEVEGKHETARRMRQRISAVCCFAIASGVLAADPAASIQKAMAKQTKKAQPAVIDLEAARTMLEATEAMPAHPVTKFAHRFTALTAPRQGNVCSMEWSQLEDLDGPAPIWRLPASVMKSKADHIVPLPRQALEIIQAVRQFSGRSKFVFPNARTNQEPMSNGAIRQLLIRAGYGGKHVPHGWRSTFSSVMNEKFPNDRGIIDLMLAHAPKDKTESAYNRAQHAPRRRELAQLWADMLLAEMDPAGDMVEGARR